MEEEKGGGGQRRDCPADGDALKAISEGLELCKHFAGLERRTTMNLYVYEGSARMIMCFIGFFPCLAGALLRGCKSADQGDFCLTLYCRFERAGIGYRGFVAALLEIV